MTVAVLTLDQQGSRSEQDAVPALLETLSPQSFSAPPLLPFQRTVGDELQGVVDAAETGIETVARALRSGVWNIGIGLGPVETPLPAETRAARGRAFVLAREAVTRAKSTPHKLAVVGAEEDPAVEHLETVLGLWAGILERRTPGGWEVHDLLVDGLSHSEAAERLGITQSAVSQRAATAGLVDEQRARALAVHLWNHLLSTKGA